MTLWKSRHGDRLRYCKRKYFSFTLRHLVPPTTYFSFSALFLSQGREEKQNKRDGMRRGREQSRPWCYIYLPICNVVWAMWASHSKDLLDRFSSFSFFSSSKKLFFHPPPPTRNKGEYVRAPAYSLKKLDFFRLFRNPPISFSFLS